jgi:Asp-tRNA(Asn)/Glu-tRNA(Gln) amidotransferase C subunit
MKVIIELEFDTYTPTTKDIIKYVNELGEDLDWTTEDPKKITTKKGESKTNYKESLTDILDYLEETESDREDDDEVSERILKDVKNLRKLEGEL